MRRRAINPNGTLIQPYKPAEHRLPVDRPTVQYVRQSSRLQQKRNRQSTAMQDVNMRDMLISVHGWKPELILQAIDEDSGKSGRKRKDERKGLAKLYELIETEKVGAVAAYNVSRIYRTISKAEIGAFCDLVLEKGIPIVTTRRIYWPTKEDNKALLADFQAAADYIDDQILGTVVAAKNYHIQNDASWGGGFIPFGYWVPAMGDTEAIVKRYEVYEEHARLIRWLFRRFRELSGNLALLGRELKETNFRFPAFPDGMPHHVALKPDTDGSYPLRNRFAIVSILTNRAYIGWYVYNGVIASRDAHEPIVPMDDFMFAWKRLSNVSLDGTDEQEQVVRERRYSNGSTQALLDDVVTATEPATGATLPVYIVGGAYSAWINNNGFSTYAFTAPVETVDKAFAQAMIAILVALELARRKGLEHDIQARVDELKQQEEKLVADYTGALARIDEEIAVQEMAQRISLKHRDEPGYEKATQQLVTLRRDRAAIEAKSKQASAEVSQLEECHNLIECACQQWEAMPMHARKRLVKLLVESANMVEVSPHFIRLDVVLDEPVHKAMHVYIWRDYGSKQVWTSDERATLARLWPYASREAILEALPMRSWDSLRLEARRRGLVREVQIGTGPHNTRAYTHADMRVMRETGARPDKPVWVVEDVPEHVRMWAGVMVQTYGAQQGRAQG